MLKKHFENGHCEFYEKFSCRKRMFPIQSLGLECKVCLSHKIWYGRYVISPGDYIFQRPFLMGLFLERLIFGEAYLRGEIYFSKSIGLALQLEVNLPFLPCFTLYLRAIFQVQAPGGLYLEG